MARARRSCYPHSDWSNADPAERRDLAFRLAAAPLPTGPGTPAAAEPDCLADMDLDGSYSVPDIFLFLAEWFAGRCP